MREIVLTETRTENEIARKGKENLSRMISIWLVNSLYQEKRESGRNGQLPSKGLPASHILLGKLCRHRMPRATIAERSFDSAPLLLPINWCKQKNGRGTTTKYLEGAEGHIRSIFYKPFPKLHFWLTDMFILLVNMYTVLMFFLSYLAFFVCAVFCASHSFSCFKRKIVNCSQSTKWEKWF